MPFRLESTSIRVNKRLNESLNESLNKSLIDSLNKSLIDSLNKSLTNSLNERRCTYRASTIYASS